MDYLIALLKGMSGEHWMLSLLLTVIVIQLGFIGRLFMETRQKDKIINEAHEKAMRINEKFSESADKASENALNFSKALTDLLIVFKDMKKSG